MRPLVRAGFLALFLFSFSPEASARLEKGPNIHTKDSTLSVEKAKLPIRQQAPVDVEELSDKTGTSLWIRPGGKFGWLIRIDRLSIGKHAFAPGGSTIDAIYLTEVLKKLRVLTYSQRGIKHLGTPKEETISIDNTTAVLAIDLMSVDANGNYVPKQYRGFLVFERGGSIVIAHYESSGVFDEEPIADYVANLTAIFHAVTVQSKK